MNEPKVTVVGSYNVGLLMKGPRFPVPGETLVGDTFAEGPGGKGSNQVIAAAKFGAACSFVACVGDDNYGRDALQMYEQRGIGTDAIRVVPGTHTGIGFILIDAAGQNLIEIVLGANLHLSEKDIDANEAVIAGSGIVGFQLEGDAKVVDYGIRKAHGMGVATLLDPAPAAPLDESLYAFIDYIKPNETEASLLTGMEVTDAASAKEACKWFCDHGVGTAIVTLGEQGSVVMGDGVAEHTPATKVEAADTTGAGDVYSGALMAALARRMSLGEAVEFASHAAALSVTRMGVVEAIPELDEVAEFLAQSRKG